MKGTVAVRDGSIESSSVKIAREISLRFAEEAAESLCSSSFLSGMRYMTYLSLVSQRDSEYTLRVIFVGKREKVVRCDVLVGGDADGILSEEKIIDLLGARCGASKVVISVTPPRGVGDEYYFGIADRLFSSLKKTTLYDFVVTRGGSVSSLMRCAVTDPEYLF